MGCPFNAVIPAFFRYKRASHFRYLLTLRADGRLLGNCAMFMDNSTHSQNPPCNRKYPLFTYLQKRAKAGWRAILSPTSSAPCAQVRHREIHITMKTVRRAAVFRMLGYRHVENGLTKILRGVTMCSPKPPKPDPLIGQAAKQNADIAQAAARRCAGTNDVGEGPHRDARSPHPEDRRPADCVGRRRRRQSGIAVGNLPQAICACRRANGAANVRFPERQERSGGGGSVRCCPPLQGALESNQRAMEHMGVNPSSGKFTVHNERD